HHAVAIDADLLRIRSESVIPSNHGALGDFALRVMRHAADTLKSNGKRRLGIINALPVIGIDVMDASSNDVDQYLLLGRSWGGHFGVLQNFGSTMFCYLDCIHVFQANCF